MANDLRYRRLGRAKMAGLSGDFAVAYKLMDTLLGQFPDDPEIHRLYGNILELDAFSDEILMGTGGVKSGGVKSLFNRFMQECQGRPAGECQEELASSLDWLGRAKKITVPSGY